MPDTSAYLSERLLDEGEKSIAFFQALTPEQLNQIVYTEGSRWTARQVMAHFASAERSLLKLIENIAAGGVGSPVDFDVNGYNERKVNELKDESLLDLVEKFRQNRLKTATFVAGLETEELQRQGRHPFLGVAPLFEIIKIIYRHNQIHQREIRQELKST